MKRYFKKLISTFLAVSLLTCSNMTYCIEATDETIICDDVQMTYIGDILTLNVYYDVITSRIFSEMCITYTERMPEIYCSYDKENFVLTEASDENRYSFAPNANAEEIFVKAVQTLADGSVLVSDIKTINIRESAIANAAYLNGEDELAYMPSLYSPEPIAVLSRYFPSGFAEMLSIYADGSYFSQTGKACTCHGRSKNCDYDYTIDYCSCDCIKYNHAIQCMAFGYMAYYFLHNNKNVGTLTPFDKKWEDSNITAKELLLNGGNKTGIYLRVQTKSGSPHSLVIVSANERSLGVYHANMDNYCGVRYQAYTWSNFEKDFPYLYSYSF